MDQWWAAGHGDPSRMHAEALSARHEIEQARQKVADCFGARSREVVFTSGATESIAAAVRGASYRGAHQVLSAVEHSAVRLSVERLEAGDHRATVVGVDSTGQVDPAEMAAAIGPDTAAVHCQWANHEVGTVQPVAEVVAACRERSPDVLIHVDAAAAAGRVPIGFGEVGADLMSISAHKLGGPPGSGALLVRRGVRLVPLLEGGDQERARRAGVPCVLLSPVPSLEALRSRPVMRPSRGTERAGWPQVDVVDRRSEDPGRAGLYSPKLVQALRDGGRAACVLNRRGRSLLLACRVCGELAVCAECGAPMRQDDDKRLVCRSAGHSRPTVCAECGSTAMRNLRAGIKRVREEIEALVRTPVAEATGGGEVGPPTARVVVGTEAVLHLGRPFEVVAFLEFDQELLAPRFRAREQALALIARAARITGPRESGGKIVLQTRLPDDPVVTAALRADAALLARYERDRRQELGLPPYGAIAVVSGPEAGEYMARFGAPLGIQIAPDPGGQFFLRAPDYNTLCDALASVERPSGRLRIDVDPIRAI